MESQFQSADANTRTARVIFFFFSAFSVLVLALWASMYPMRILIRLKIVNMKLSYCFAPQESVISPR